MQCASSTAANEPRRSQRLAELVAGQRLRGGHHQQRAARRDALQRLAPRDAADRAVEALHRDAARQQLLVLVAEERQQRRHEHDRARQDHRGHLVAGGFAEAGRQDDEHVVARERCRNRTFLLG